MRKKIKKTDKRRLLLIGRFFSFIQGQKLFAHSQMRLKTAIFICLLLLFSSACSELDQPKAEEFYADSHPPRQQEFRWSNGNTPKSFDPALASASPETDIVRAIYDGLTETDPKNLKAVPAIAADWSSSDDFKVWTFKLRKDAKWSNGEKVTAMDFVRSWKRLADMGDEVSHYELLKNIAGIQKEEKEDAQNAENVFSKQSKHQILKDNTDKKLDLTVLNSNSNTNSNLNEILPPPPLPKSETDKKEVKEFGVEAIDDYTLKVILIKSDKDFPQLAAHPLLRPVYASGKEFERNKLNPKIVTNGAFRLISVAKDGVTLEKSQTYYNKGKIKLERVRFVPAKDADSALQAYRRGEVDAVTNAEFEPLAFKLLLPFEDFQRTTHGALNFYEFNRKNTPFNDRRVREALAISIDRERLTEDDTKGATKPAFTFLPFNEKKKASFSFDVGKAKNLLKKSGFPNGENFPVIKLVINRNDIQQRIARSVAKMWKENLNIETEIIVKETEEFERIKNSGEFDLIRRGIVFPTADETANMLTIFAPKEGSKIKKTVVTKEEKDKEEDKSNEKKSTDQPKPKTLNSVEKNTAVIDSPIQNNPNVSEDPEEELLVDIGEEIILLEEEAIIEVYGIPLYFPLSYSLVKPYVKGFEMNNLDSPLLKDVEIDNNWQPKTGANKS